MTYNFPLLDVVEEDEVTEHGDEAEQAQAGHYVDHSVLQIKLSWTVQFRWLIEGLAGCLAGIISISVCWRQQTADVSNFLDWPALPCTMITNLIPKALYRVRLPSSASMRRYLHEAEIFLSADHGNVRAENSNQMSPIFWSGTWTNINIIREESYTQVIF